MRLIQSGGGKRSGKSNTPRSVKRTGLCRVNAQPNVESGPAPTRPVPVKLSAIVLARVASGQNAINAATKRPGASRKENRGKTFELEVLAFKKVVVRLVSQNSHAVFIVL